MVRLDADDAAGLSTVRRPTMSIERGEWLLGLAAPAELGVVHGPASIPQTRGAAQTEGAAWVTTTVDVKVCSTSAWACAACAAVREPATLAAHMVGRLAVSVPGA